MRCTDWSRASTAGDRGRTGRGGWRSPGSGPVATVYAELGRRRGYAADDDVFLALDHREGQTTHLHASALAGAPTPRFRVSGDGGAYLKYGLDVQEEVLRTGEVPVSGESGREPEGSWGRLHRGGDGSSAATSSVIALG